MRSEFEKLEEIANLFKIGNFQFNEDEGNYTGTKGTALSYLRGAWVIYQHQQSKVDDLTKQLTDQGQRFNEQSQRVKDLEHRNGELQKRVDASSKVLESIRKEIKHGHLSDDESQTLSSYANDLEQALKGEKQ